MNPTQLSRFSEAVAQAVQAAHEAAEPPSGGPGTRASREGGRTGDGGVRSPSPSPPHRPTLSRKAS